MTAATPQDVLVNPSNSAQRYVLWGNGRIDVVGGAPPITSGSSQGAWFDRLDQPVGVALWITDWTTGAGYVLDFQGGERTLNGATELTQPFGSPQTTWTNTNGLPYVESHLYVDWSWDPSGSGQGYALTAYGELVPFGGAPSPPRTGARFSTPNARKITMQWAPVKKAIVLDIFGRLYPEFSGVVNTGPGWPGWDAARDVIVTDWSDPQSGYMLDLYGGNNPFGNAPVVTGNPYNRGGDNARTLSIINPSNPLKLFQVWANGQQFEYVSSTAPTVTAGNGVSEVQYVTITGTPTGGNFQLTFSGQTTIATAFNAAASVVQTNLRALSSIGSTGVTVTGGPGPGIPYVVTFTGTLANTGVPAMTASNTFTGGSSPAIGVITPVDGVSASPANIVTTTTRPTLSWSYSDAQKDSQAEWQVVLYTASYVAAHADTATDPLNAQRLPNAVAFGSDTNPSTRGVVAAVDLTNQDYTYFVRAMDTSGLWSAWASRTWTQNVPAPATPTSMSAVADQRRFLANLSCRATVGGSADTIMFQYSDDGGLTWNPVRGGDAVALAPVTPAVDYDIPLGVFRTYRAIAYNDSPYVVSATSTTVATKVLKQTHVLTAVDDPTLGGEVNVVVAPSWTRTSKAGVFEGINAEFPTVVSDGVPKSRKTSLTIDCNSEAEWQLIEDLAKSNSTLVWRDPFGAVGYYRLVGDWTRTQVRRAPSADETTSLRHAHQTVLPLIEVAEPVLTSLFSTTPPGP